MVVALFFASVTTLEAAAVAVRFPEGSQQGYLILRGPKGEELAIGDLQQQAREGDIHNRLVLRFKDGSLYDETVVFSQRQTFAMRQYRLIQRGPSFPTALEASIDGPTGRYKVTAREEGEKEETFEGQLALPPDVANGMLAVLLKNLPQGATRTVHIVAFRPKPLLVELELAPEGVARFSVGDTQRQALHYRLTPKLGVFGVFASLIGKDVSEYHYWILGGGAPAFLAFEGPLYVDGPVWRVELVSPQWPKGESP
jgi:hypothetical protein